MYLDPQWIIVEFLRKRLTDPRTRASTANTDNFTATASQTVFQLTPSAGTLSYVTAVTVDAVAKVKWRDYYIDLELQQIIFFTGITVSSAVVVTYYSGTTDWVYPDKPMKKLQGDSWPRISVQTVSNPGVRLGNYEAPVQSIALYQIDIWTKEKADDQIFTIDSHKYTGEKLATYLAFQICNAFEDYENDLYPALYGYEPNNLPRNLPFDDELQCHHSVVEAVLRGISIGRIS